MADYTDYPKIARALAGTNGSDTLEECADVTGHDPQTIFNEYMGSTSPEMLQEIDDILGVNETPFDEIEWEIPLEGDLEWFDELVETNEPVRLLYNLIASRDGYENFGVY